MTEDAKSVVTVVIKRKVRAGHEAAYEDCLRRLTEAARDQQGYLGADIHPPAKGKTVYTSVVRFDSLANLELFEGSELRRRFLEEVAPHVEEDAVWEKMSGLEFWFDPPAGAVIPQPSLFRMAILLTGVVFTLVLTIGGLVGLVIGHWPYPLRLLVTITIEVFFMTYFVMPRLTRALSKWIYPSSKVA